MFEGVLPPKYNPPMEKSSMVVCRISMLLPSPMLKMPVPPCESAHFEMENAVFCELIPIAVDNAFVVTFVSFKFTSPWVEKIVIPRPDDWIEVESTRSDRLEALKFAPVGAKEFSNSQFET